MNENYIKKLLKNYNIKIDLSEIKHRYSEPHRFYHTLKHINFILKKIDGLFSKNIINKKDKEILYIATLFHDIIYDPLKNNNEKKSSDLFLNKISEHSPNVNQINKIILNTIDHKSHGNKLSKIFNDLDMYNLFNSDLKTLKKDESDIRKEYSMFSNKLYRKGRLDFLNSLLKYNKNTENIKELINHVDIKYKKLKNIKNYINFNISKNILKKIKIIFLIFVF
jgi:predicted metal-dependent HD superfamily phosphohydrolase